MANDQRLRFLGLPDFQDFLTSKGIAPDDPQLPLLKECWNTAIRSACEYFGGQEGTDHGTLEILTVP